MAIARTRVRSPALLYILFFTTLFLPQFFLSVPGLPEIARTTDFAAGLCLALYAYTRMRAPQAGRSETLLLFFLAGTVVVSVGALTMMTLSPELAMRLDLERTLYPVRHLFLFAPALFAMALQAPRRRLVALGLFTFACAAAFVVLMTVAYYASGRELFQGRQSIQYGRGQGFVYFKRMGGVVGETGAYGFHATFVFYALTLFVFMRGLTRLGYLLLAMTPVWLLMVFASSQTRIVLPAGMIFLAAALLNRDLFRRRTALTLVVMAAALPALYLALLGMLDLPLPVDRVTLLRFEALLSGEASADALTSGRWQHWGGVLRLWLENPVLGYGYRNVSFILGHAVENFFLQGLSEYGLVVFAVLCAFLVRLWLGVRAASRLSPEMGRAGAVLQAMLLAAFVQWQVNDINTYYQTFPMLLALGVLFGAQAERAEPAARPAPERPAPLCREPLPA